MVGFIFRQQTHNARHVHCSWTMITMATVRALHIIILYGNVRPSSVFAHFLRVIIIHYLTRKQIESDRRSSHLDSRTQLIIISTVMVLFSAQ